MAKDIILVAYANDADQSLGKVEEEANEIVRILTTGNGDEVEVHLMADASLQKIWKFFENHHDRIIAFHFAGHGNGTAIFLAGGQEAAIEGLSGLLRQAPKLRFVFLNACATKGLVEYLHRAGVRSVIATSVAIEDDAAFDFAIHFYSPLSNFWTIGRSYEFARSFLCTRPGLAYAFLEETAPFTPVPHQLADDSDALPWGIYYNPAFDPKKDGDEDLISSLADWTLPDSTAKLEAPANYDPNYNLIELIAGNAVQIADKLDASTVAAAQQDPDKYPDVNDLIRLRNLYKDQKAGDAENLVPLADIIIRLLPYPLGVLLRRMMTIRADMQQVTEAEDYLSMLQTQINLYQTLLRLYSYTMLSSLWDMIEKQGVSPAVPQDVPPIEALPDLTEKVLESSNSNSKKGVRINKGQRNYLDNFLQLDAKTREEFDYASFTRVIREILENNTPSPFIQEYENVKQGFENREGFYHSHLFIQGLKLKLRHDKVHELLYPGLCSRMEEELINVFKTVFFILRYKLVVVKDIEFVKGRYPPGASYQHRRIFLHRVNDSPLSEEEFSSTSHTDSYSVLFIRGRDDLNDYISLSPFVIDKNALTGDGSSKLYFFSHSTKNAHVFECLDDPRSIIRIDNEQFEYLDGLKRTRYELKKIQRRFLGIKEQFEAFKKKVQTLQFTDHE
jgi:hypothetical protein